LRGDAIHGWRRDTILACGEITYQPAFGGLDKKSVDCVGGFFGPSDWFRTSGSAALRHCRPAGCPRSLAASRQPLGDGNHEAAGSFA